MILYKIHLYAMKKESEEKKLQFDDPCQKQVYDSLSDEPNNIDDIAENISLKSKEASAALLKLQMKGLIKQLPGRLYIKA